MINSYLIKKCLLPKYNNINLLKISKIYKLLINNKSNTILNIKKISFNKNSIIYFKNNNKNKKKVHKDIQNKNNKKINKKKVNKDMNKNKNIIKKKVNKDKNKIKKKVNKDMNKNKNKIFLRQVFNV